MRAGCHGTGPLTIHSSNGLTVSRFSDASGTKNFYHGKLNIDYVFFLLAALSRERFQAVIN